MHHFITTGPPVFLVKSFSTLVSLHFIKQCCSAIVDKKPGNSHLGSIFVGRGTNTKSIVFAQCTQKWTKFLKWKWSHLQYKLNTSLRWFS